MQTPRVYWAAQYFSRWWSPGNHHFLLVVAPPRGLFPIIRYKEAPGFVTLGAFNIHDTVTFRANHNDDVWAMYSIIDRAPYFESREIMQAQKISKEGDPFASELFRRCYTFQSNTRTRPVPHELLGDDCAPWILALLRACGISMAECERVGKLSTYPQSQRLSFPKEMFERQLPPDPDNPPRPIYPGHPRNGKRLHTVKEGEWLSKIAIAYYGDMNKWPVIFEANKDKISDPNRIEVGQLLVIP